MKFSLKLQKEIHSLNNKFDLITMLSYIYINQTSIKTCSQLFNCDSNKIIEILKAENLYEYQLCKRCQKLLKYSEFKEDIRSLNNISGGLYILQK